MVYIKNLFIHKNGLNSAEIDRFLLLNGLILSLSLYNISVTGRKNRG